MGSDDDVLGVGGTDAAGNCVEASHAGIDLDQLGDLPNPPPPLQDGNLVCAVDRCALDMNPDEDGSHRRLLPARDHRRARAGAVEDWHSPSCSRSSRRSRPSRWSAAAATWRSSSACSSRTSLPLNEHLRLHEEGRSFSSAMATMLRN